MGILTTKYIYLCAFTVFPTVRRRLSNEFTFHNTELLPPQMSKQTQSSNNAHRMRRHRQDATNNGKTHPEYLTVIDTDYQLIDDDQELTDIPSTFDTRETTKEREADPEATHVADELGRQASSATTLMDTNALMLSQPPAIVQTVTNSTPPSLTCVNFDSSNGNRSFRSDKGQSSKSSTDNDSDDDSDSSESDDDSDSSESDDDSDNSESEIPNRSVRTIASLLCEDESQKIDRRVKKSVDLRATYEVCQKATRGTSSESHLVSKT
jgi:hypothetical protein